MAIAQKRADIRDQYKWIEESDADSDLMTSSSEEDDASSSSDDSDIICEDGEDKKGKKNKKKQKKQKKSEKNSGDEDEDKKKKKEAKKEKKEKKKQEIDEDDKLIGNGKGDSPKKGGKTNREESPEYTRTGRKRRACTKKDGEDSPRRSPTPPPKVSFLLLALVFFLSYSFFSLPPRLLLHLLHRLLFSFTFQTSTPNFLLFLFKLRLSCFSSYYLFSPLTIAFTKSCLRQEEEYWWTPLVKEACPGEGDLGKPEFSGKMSMLINILRESESVGDKVLVFSQSLSSLDMIEDYLAYENGLAKEVRENIWILVTKCLFKGHGKCCDAFRNTQFLSPDFQGKLTESTASAIWGWTLDDDYFRMDGGTNCENRQRQMSLFNDKENSQARLFLISTRAGIYPHPAVFLLTDKIVFDLIQLYSCAIVIEYHMSQGPSERI